MIARWFPAGVVFVFLVFVMSEVLPRLSAVVEVLR